MQPPTEPLITAAPAPWDLKGRGYISLLRFPTGSGALDRFVPVSLQGRRSTTRWAWMMFVDYQTSAVGPYHELLFIPGSFPFEDGQRHLSISRIFVSSMDSVVNGRRNWGIPKDLAQFEVRYGAQGVDQVTIRQDGALVAELKYRHYPLWLPFSTALVPRSLRTLGQHQENRSFVYTPSATGWVTPARLIEARSNPGLFPDLRDVSAPLTLRTPRFAMRFPVSQIYSLPSESLS